MRGEFVEREYARGDDHSLGEKLRWRLSSNRDAKRNQFEAIGLNIEEIAAARRLHLHDPRYLLKIKGALRRYRRPLESLVKRSPRSFSSVPFEIYRKFAALQLETASTSLTISANFSTKTFSAKNCTERQRVGR